ncbi:MAG: TolC family protein [Marinovum sp.]|nr:TolC family protein [Marinovum sp.]
MKSNAVIRWVVLGSVALLAGCMPGREGAGESVSRFLQDPVKAVGLNGALGKDKTSDAEVTRAATDMAVPTQTETLTERRDGTASPIIKELQARKAILPSGSAYDSVARSVLASSARIEEAELKAAHLRAQAAKYNWLPKLGPDISLTSLGDFVTSLFIEQVLFDNGRKIAERDYALHDVEKAAVAMSQASNNRVHDALSLYLAIEEGRSRIVIADRSLKDMSHFEWVMTERVKGGVSDRSDLNILRQKLAEIRAERDAAVGQIATAQAELTAMAGRPLAELHGRPGFVVDRQGRDTLDVLLAEAERDLAVAQAKIARAQHLPGLSATGTVSSVADASGAISVGSDQLFGIGTGASLKAIEATKDTATRKVSQAREDAERRLAAIDRQAETLSRQLAETTRLTAQAKANLDLFQAQYKGGARQVMDVVGVYETWARQSQLEIGQAFELERLRLQKAQVLGLLADGALI